MRFLKRLRNMKNGGHIIWVKCQGLQWKNMQKSRLGGRLFLRFKDRQLIVFSKRGVICTLAAIGEYLRIRLIFSIYHKEREEFMKLIVVQILVPRAGDHGVLVVRVRIGGVDDMHFKFCWFFESCCFCQTERIVRTGRLPFLFQDFPPPSVEHWRSSHDLNDSAMLLR